VPDLDPVVDAEPRGERCGEQETTVWRPFAVGCVWGVYGAHLGEGSTVYDLDFSGEVAKPCERDESALRVEGDEVVR
jgi:hypothetical protein